MASSSMSEIADGGAATDVVPVALLATEQRGDGERGAAVGSVLRGNETAKDPVAGNTSLAIASKMALLRRCCCSGEMLEGNSLVGSRNGSAAMMPWHCGKPSTKMTKSLDLRNHP